MRASRAGASRRVGSRRAACGLADPLVDAGERLGRVEVARERVEERCHAAAPGRSGDAPGDEPPGRLADAADVGLGLLERRLGEGERLAVVPGDEIHDDRLAAVCAEHLVQQRDVADRLGHLLAGELDHAVVHPQLRELAAACRAGLGGLVLVVGEDQVRAAAVDVEADPEQLLGHGRALDVPARAPWRPTASPRRCPRPCLCAFQSAKSSGIVLALCALHALALVHVLQLAVREGSVGGVRAHAEVDVAVGGDRRGRPPTSVSI